MGTSLKICGTIHYLADRRKFPLSLDVQLIINLSGAELTSATLTYILHRLSVTFLNCITRSTYRAKRTGLTMSVNFPLITQYELLE